MFQQKEINKLIYNSLTKKDMKKKTYKNETAKIQKQIIGKFTVETLNGQVHGFGETIPLDTITMTSSLVII